MTDSAPIEVRRAREEDIPTLLAIWSEFVDAYVAFDVDFEVAEDAPQVLLEEMRNAFEDERTILVIAEIGGKTVGFLRGWIDDNVPGYLPALKGFIHEIVVRSEHRGHHVGKMLVREAVRWFRSRDADVVEIRISGQNSIARAFWAMEGFKEKQFVMEMDLRQAD
jgi:ribosomal protein S18 acetylase RimI-like enzyme